MSRLNYQNKMEGHRVGTTNNRDLEQKLTYQQLLNLNHDLSKENQQLKNIGNRLGQELRNLHSQFDIKPREQNAELYNAIGNHPMLHQYELTLIPLLDAYEAKIQEFENGFETINEEFINLEKKYKQVTDENEHLRSKLTDKITELIEVYKNGGSEKLGADFSQIILQQINQKQKFLVQQNSRLEREYQKYKSQTQKNSKQLAQYKKKYQEIFQRAKLFQQSQKQIEKQLKSLKQNLFNSQLKNNEIDIQKKKLENDLQRAQSQLSLIVKDRENLLNNYQNLKKKYDQDVSIPQEYEEKKFNSVLNIGSLRETSPPVDDSHKKLQKLQKEFESLQKERNKLKEQLQSIQISFQESNDRISELKKKIENIELEKKTFEMSDIKNKKLLDQMTEKSKNDIEKLKRIQEQQIEKLEDDYFRKIEQKQKKINEIQQALDKARLEKDKFQQQNIIHTTLNKENKGGKNKDSDRAAEKLKEKLAMNEELFREQLQIVQNDNVYLKRQAETYKAQAKEKSQDNRKIKQEIQKIRKECVEVSEQKSILIQQIKRVKLEFEGNLRDKQRLFDQKIKEIKQVVQQSDKRRKVERQKISEASREHKRVLEEIRNTYEERIKILQGENPNYNSKVRKIQY